MNVVYAPDNFEIKSSTTKKRPFVFLAGSIEMGKAEDWQDILINDFKNIDVVFLNPRRKDWDSSWEQKIENEKFYEQVMWELNGLERADIIYFYFSEDTKSPISLLELGLVAKDNNKRVIVYCPDKFYRKGNVDIVCEKYGMLVFNDLEKSKNVLEALILLWENENEND
jgi:hypothetical protein